jgi:hypothetical protein
MLDQLMVEVGWKQRDDFHFLGGEQKGKMT